MKILIYSPAYLPSIGGLEIGQALLADRLTRLGHEVTVVTRTPAAEVGGDAGGSGSGARGGSAGSGSRGDSRRNTGGMAAIAGFTVLRRPGPRALLRAVRACDVFFQANVSLRGLWPLLLVRRPWAVSHHSWYCRTNGRIAWQDRLKRFLLRFAAVSISVSQAMAADLDTPSLVIPNTYRDHLFRQQPEVERGLDLIFLGRLVSDKGVDLLIAALGQLAEHGLRPHLTIVGDGPELPELWAQAARLGVAEQVELLGTRRDRDLVPLLNRHRILVMPSRYNEPFGVAALEGIACGCVIVGSAGGGLPEAIGPCGRIFPNGDVAGLTAVLTDLLLHPERHAALRAGAAEHLARHASERIAKLYEEALAAAVPVARTKLPSMNSSSTRQAGRPGGSG